MHYSTGTVDGDDKQESDSVAESSSDVDSEVHNDLDVEESAARKMDYELYKKEIVLCFSVLTTTNTFQLNGKLASPLSGRVYIIPTEYMNGQWWGAAQFKVIAVSGEKINTDNWTCRFLRALGAGGPSILHLDRKPRNGRLTFTIPKVMITTQHNTFNNIYVTFIFSALCDLSDSSDPLVSILFFRSVCFLSFFT